MIEFIYLLLSFFCHVLLKHGINLTYLYTLKDFMCKLIKTVNENGKSPVNENGKSPKMPIDKMYI